VLLLTHKEVACFGCQGLCSSERELLADMWTRHLPTRCVSCTVLRAYTTSTPPRMGSQRNSHSLVNWLAACLPDTWGNGQAESPKQFTEFS